jgi:fructose-specific phosphotransferase system IIC component
VTALLSAGATNNFETQKDSQAPGIANALYFARSIGAIRNMDQLMSDPKLLEVAQIAAKMPKQFGSLDFNTQVRLLSAKVKISDFAKPGFVQQFVTKYLAINAQNNSTVNDTTGALAILTSSGSSDNMLTTLLPSSNSSANPVLSLFSSGGGSSSTSILSLIA